MLNDNRKNNVNFLLCNKTYSFINDVKTTEPEQFLDLKRFYIENLYIGTIVAIKIQLQA